MIDFHSHILPGIDDGSKDAATSLLMLNALKKQGADTVCATSHFYATQRTVDRFLFRRQEAWDRLCEVLPQDAPRILLGAEVLYYPGIANMEELPSLCLEGTRLLLLEMPFEPWTGYMTREVSDLARRGDVQLLMAHIERYFFYQPISVKPCGSWRTAISTSSARTPTTCPPAPPTWTRPAPASPKPSAKKPWNISTPSAANY